MDVTLLLVGYFLIINLIGFLTMGVDKRKAIKHTFRIPEATLFVLALIGGSLGTTLGMYVFRHKTRHWYFVYGMPAIFILQVIIALALYYSPLQFITL